MKEDLIVYLDKNCPIKRNTFRREKPEWLTPEVAQLMRDRDLALRRARKTQGVQRVRLRKGNLGKQIPGKRQKVVAATFCE